MAEHFYDGAKRRNGGVPGVAVSNHAVVGHVPVRSKIEAFRTY